ALTTCTMLSTTRLSTLLARLVSGLTTVLVWMPSLPIFNRLRLLIPSLNGPSWTLTTCLTMFTF
ncbi:hypothetical protein HDU76_009229, partial [Blyttiomyces sp. JEL0837]